MQGTERRRAGFYFPLMDQVVFLGLTQTVSNPYYVLFTVFICRLMSTCLLRISSVLHGFLHDCVCKMSDDIPRVSDLIDLIESLHILVINILPV